MNEIEICFMYAAQDQRKDYFYLFQYLLIPLLEIF